MVGASGETGEASRRRRRLLLVDDEPAMRLLCRVNLPLSGFDVVEADSAEAALERVYDEQFDVIVLDVMMPGATGWEVAARLRADERTASVPIVFVSARADQSDIRRGFDVGAADYVTKPFDPVQFGDHLHAVLHAIENGEGDRLRRARLAEPDGA